MANDNQQLIEIIVPKNIGENWNFKNVSFEPRRALEGIVGALLGGFITFKILFYLNQYYLDISTTTIATGIILVSAGMGALFFFGGNNEPFSMWIYHIIKFKKHKRVAYYNSRVKTEKRPPLTASEENKEVLPREKIIAFIDNYKKVTAEKNAQSMTTLENNYDGANQVMFFEDDIGVVEKPLEYMSKSEIKAKKNQEKQAIKAKNNAKEKKKASKHVSQKKSVKRKKVVK